MPDNRGLAAAMLLFRGDTAISPGPLGVSGISEKREWGVPALMGVATAGDLALGETPFGDLAFGVLNRSFTPDGLTALFFIALDFPNDLRPFLGRAAGVFTLFLPMTMVMGESACPVVGAVALAMVLGVLVMDFL